MGLIDNYIIIKTINEDNGFVFKEAIRKHDHTPCILKTTQRSNSRLATQLEHEWEIATHLDPDWATIPFALESSAHDISAIYGQHEAVFLDKLIENSPLEIKTFLPIAINIAKALGKMHQKGIVHKDIRPANILINPATNEVRLFNFGIASIIPWGYLQTNSHSENIEGTFEYMSPEQTGKMNRNIDYRSDLYSLGISFYQLLTRQLPFNAKDPLEWVYCHLARNPLPPNALNPEIPQMLSSIIMKLISKLAEDRYQSSAGLIYDLKKCMAQHESIKKTSRFTLGSKDFSGKFQVSQKIYGRENEIEQLLNTYENVITTGNSALVLISGYSGVGKTSLVHFLHKPIVRECGFFISGKFDQFNKNIPYFTIAEAFGGMARFILSQDERSIREWRKKIVDAVGPNGQMMINLIPQLELVIGKQPALTHLPAAEYENLFNLVFQKFIAVFAAQEHPLVLFLDDLQWADLATLNLMSQLFVTSNSYLYLIAAYREHEVSESQLLSLKIEDLKSTTTVFKEIRLMPLDKAAIHSLVSDSLRLSKKKTKELAELVYSKTSGNPFFTIQFLMHLYQEHLLHFHHETAEWKWDLEKINAKGFTDNVVDLLVDKIRRLDEETQKLLKRAACFGNTVNKKMLVRVAANKEQEVHASLSKAVTEGLVYSFEDYYSFIHDRVRQAAHENINGNLSAYTHLKIAQLMYADTSADNETEEFVYDIASHYNEAISIITDKGEKITAAKLNLRAAQKARSSVAYSSAMKYADHGIFFLPDDAWTVHHDLTFGLYMHKAECCLLNGKPEEAKDILNFIQNLTKNKTDNAQVCRLKMVAYIHNGEFPLAISEAITCLETFNLHLNPHPSHEEVMAFYQEVLQIIGNRKIDELVELPLMTNPEIKAAMSVLSEMYTAAMLTDINFFNQHFLYMVYLSLQYGNCEFSVGAYSGLGVVIAKTFKNYQQAYRFSRLALEVTNKHFYWGYKTKGLFGVGIVSFWVQPVDITIKILREALETSINTGDLPISGFSIINLLNALFIKGQSLDRTSAELQSHFEFLQKLKLFDNYNNYFRSQQQFIANMQGRTDNFSTFNGADYNELEMEKAIEAEVPIMIVWYNISKLKARFISGDYDEALHIGQKLYPNLWMVQVFSPELELYFFYSLAIAATYDTVAETEREKNLQLLKSNAVVIENWVIHCPETFSGKHRLLSAEIARIENKDADAMRFFEEAIQHASTNSFMQDEAIAAERAADFFYSRKMERIARMYMEHAFKCYFNWGAHGRTVQLSHKYPFLNAHMLRATTEEEFSTQNPDLIALIKTSQAISGEIKFDQLIAQLMSIVLKQSGAQRGCLLLNRDNRLQVIAEAKTGRKGTKISTHDVFGQPLHTTYPETVINYVGRTKEKLVIDDLSAYVLLNNDEYFTQHHPKSIACLPLLHQAKLTGVIYLENSFFTNAFSASGISMMEILTSQAAISMENAQLFNELAITRQQLQDVMDNSSAVIFVKNPEGKYLFVNRQYETLFHITREKIAGMTDYEIWPKQVADAIWANDIKVLEEDHPITFEETVPHDDGFHTYVAVKFPLRQITGKPYAICGIATDITDRKLAEEALHDLSAHLQDAREEERISIAREIHDELGQQLTSIKMDISWISKKILGQDGNIKDKIGGILKLLDDAVKTIRRISTELRPSILDDLGLIAAIEWHSQEFETRSGIHTEFESLVEEVSVPKNIATSLFRIYQESLTNVARHAEASKISSKLQVSNNQLILKIKDNGKGFDVNKIKSKKTLGILGMKERTMMMGGKYEIISEPGNGTTILVTVPVE